MVKNDRQGNKYEITYLLVKNMEIFLKINNLAFAR